MITIVEKLKEIPTPPGNTPTTPRQKPDKALSEAQKEMNRLNREAERLEVRKSEAVIKAAAANKKNRREIQLLTKEAMANANTIEAMRVRVSRLKDEWASTERGTKQYRVALKELGKAQRELAKEEAKGGIFGRNVGNYPKMLSGLKGIVGGFLSLRAAFNVLKGATKTITDFEQANANLATILGKNRSEIIDLTESAKQLGATTEWMASQVTELQTELAKLGFNEHQIQAMQAPILQFATAIGANLADAASLAGASLRAFNLSAEETERVVSVMTVGANKSALSFGFLETAMSTIAPVARSFGFGIEDTVALLGTLSDAGFDASTAATATRNILLNLADSNGKLAKQLGAPVKTIPELVKGLETLRDRGVNLSETLELTDKRSVAAFNTFLNGTDSLTKLRGELDNVDGELERIQKERLNTVQGSVKLFNSAWESLMLSFSGSTGFMKTVVDGLTSIVNAINNVLFKTQALQRAFNDGLANRSEAMGNDLTEQIKSFEKQGLSRDRAIELVAEEWNKEAERLKELYEQFDKRVGFYSEEDLDGTNGRKARKAAEEAKRLRDNALKSYENFVSSRDSILSRETGAGIVTPEAGAGAGIGSSSSGKGHNNLEKLAREEEKARQDIANFAVRISQKANERIMNDDKQSYEARLSALERYTADSKALVTAAADNEVENLYRRLIDEDNNGITTRKEAIEAAQQQVELIYKKSGNDIAEINRAYETGHTKLVESQVRKRIEARTRELGGEIREIDTGESDAVAAATKRHAQGLTNEREYQNELTNIQTTAEAERHTAELKALQDELALIPLENEDDRVKVEEEVANKLVEINNWRNEKMIEADKKTIEERKALEQAYRQFVSDISNELFNFVGTLVQAQTDRKLAALEKEAEDAQDAYDNEIAAIERLYEAGAISEEQANARKELSEQQLAEKEDQIEQKKREAQIKQAKYEKAQAIAQSMIATALSISTSAQMGFPLAIPFIAMAAALGAVQLATIMATPLPQYAEGTDFHRGGLAWVGDGGRSELVVHNGKGYKTPAVATLVDLPRGAEVLPDFTAAMNDHAIAMALSPLQKMPPDTRPATEYDDGAVLMQLMRSNSTLEKQLRSFNAEKKNQRFYGHLKSKSGLKTGN
jgi:TP901 family phage tail tape measure protein